MVVSWELEMHEACAQFGANHNGHCIFYFNTFFIIFYHHFTVIRLFIVKQ